MKLRTRILTGFAVVLVLVGGLGVAVVATQRNQLFDQLDRRLAAVAPLDRPAPRAPGEPRPAPGSDVGPPDGGAQATGTAPPVEEPISDLYIAAILPDGSVDVLVQGQLLEEVPDLAEIAADPPAARSFATVDAADGSVRFRVLVDPAPDGSTAVIALPTTDVDETVRRLAITFAVVVALVGAVLGVLAWWIVRLGLRPISAMTETARAISSGDRERRAPELDERTEAGELADAFNVMLDQRDEAEDRLRRFASDASHELRTPLTSIRGYLDLYEQGGFREQEQLDDVVRRMQAEARRMGLLVDDLLALARLDEGQPLSIAPVDVGGLVRDVVADALAAHPARTIVADAPADLTAPIDGDRVKQVAASLVGNAVVHAPDATIRVRAAATSDELLLSVADDGPGLDDEQAKQIFTRFFRGDSSRSRVTGGSGLGLAIAQSIAEAHGGVIDLRTAPGDGCEFTLHIPTAPAVT